jgi:hypothetical protein
MAPKQIAPALGLKSFTCPHCGAIAAQYWLKVLPKSFENLRPEALTPVEANSLPHPNEVKAAKHWRQFLTRFETNLITYKSHDYSLSTGWEMVNMSLSMCFSCDGFAVWIFTQLIWPDNRVVVEPHDDMPPM